MNQDFSTPSDTQYQSQLPVMSLLTEKYIERSTYLYTSRHRSTVHK